MASDKQAMQVMNTSASGNISFELVLSPKVLATGSPRHLRRLESGDPKTNGTTDETPASPNLTLEEIQEKLKAAELRKTEMEAQKVGQTAVKLAEAAQRREELAKRFQETAEKELQTRLDVNKENRERFLEERVEKIKEHEKYVEEVIRKKSLEPEKEKERQEHKHQRAQELRAQKLHELKEKLEAQEARVQEVCGRQVTNVSEHIEQKMKAQLKDAEERRDEILHAIAEKQHGLQHGHSEQAS